MIDVRLPGNISLHEYLHKSASHQILGVLTLQSPFKQVIRSFSHTRRTEGCQSKSKELQVSWQPTQNSCRLSSNFDKIAVLLQLACRKTL